VRELGKGANQSCKHQRHGIGCAIHKKRTQPLACRLWRCRWLRGEPTGDRPDRAGYVVDDLPVWPIIQIWVDPKHPNTWVNPDLLRYLHARMARKAMVLRWGVGADADGDRAYARQISNWEVICWLEHFGLIDDASYPYLIGSKQP